MHAKIGPFINRWSTQRFENWWARTRAGVEYSWQVEDYEETGLDKFVESVCDKWQTVLNLTVNQYYDRKQRKVKIKIDKYDTWNMDYTLGLIVLPMLIQLKETKNGSPIVNDDDVPAGMGLRSTEAPSLENNWDTDDNFHDRWEWVMDELIWTFTQLTDDDNEDQFHTGEIDLLWKPVDEDGNEVPKDGAKFHEMVAGPKDTHVFDRAAFEKHNQRIDNGLRLFGKYFRGLWT